MRSDKIVNVGGASSISLQVRVTTTSAARAANQLPTAEIHHLPTPSQRPDPYPHLKPRTPLVPRIRPERSARLSIPLDPDPALQARNARLRIEMDSQLLHMLNDGSYTPARHLALIHATARRMTLADAGARPLLVIRKDD